MPLKVATSLAVLLLIATSASAQTSSPVVSVPEGSAFATALTGPCGEEPATPLERAWRVVLDNREGRAAAGGLLATPDTVLFAATPQEAARRRPKAVQYSEAYATRLKIHRYAGFATVPLFVAQYAVGQKLYTNTSGGNRGLHAALGAGTIGLFGLNSVTGIWNLRESWKDPAGGTRRKLHAILMLVADAGFAATAVMTPRHERERGGIVTAPAGGTSRATHRGIAISSMGVALVSYVMMLLPH